MGDMNPTILACLVGALILIAVQAYLIYKHRRKQHKPQTKSQHVIRASSNTPTTCQMSPWVTTTPCSGPCGHGTKVQSRSIVVPGTDCGPLTQTVPCSASEYPCPCNWTSLSPHVPSSAMTCSGVCDNASPGQQCHLKCPKGNADGQTTFTCLSDGTWSLDSSNPMSCDDGLVHCPAITNDSYRRVLAIPQAVCENAKPGNVCSISCRVGTAPKPGETGSGICQSDGTWSESLQCVQEQCNGIDCVHGF